MNHVMAAKESPRFLIRLLTWSNRIMAGVRA